MARRCIESCIDTSCMCMCMAYIARGAPRCREVEAHNLHLIEQLFRRPHRPPYRREQPRTTKQLLERGAAEVGIGSAEDQRRRGGVVAMQVTGDGDGRLLEVLHRKPHAPQPIE